MKAPPPDRRDALHAKLRAIASSAQVDLSSLTNSELKDAAWVVLVPYGSEADAAPLASGLDFLNAYLKALHGRRNQARRAVGALIHCFLLYYPTGLPAFKGLRKRLVAHFLVQTSGPRLERWRGCADRCGLFHGDGPSQLATRLLNAEQPPDAVLNACCLRGMLATGGLVRHAFVQMIATVQGRLTRGQPTQRVLTRLCEFARTSGAGTDLRFQTERVELLNGLLLPFAEGHPEPDAAERIKSFLLEVVGDPRLSAAGWHRVDPRARRVMLGWMVTETLEDFFRLLEYAAQSDAIARRHWRDRKAFWTRYLQAGVISDAWVALGPRTRAEASRVLTASERSYATLSRTGIQQNHSAIIMRIGGMTITEWSHSGTFRAWLDGNNAAPVFYQRSYSRADLVSEADDEQKHHGDWQRRVSDLIWYRANVKI